MTAQTATAVPRREMDSTSMLLVILKARTFIALILVFVFFAFAAPNFLSTANMVIMSKHVALNAFLAIGMTFVIVSGGIDLGLGWSIQFNTIEICLLVIVVGVAVGAINGFLITKLNVAPFIATLGTLYVARGAAMLSSDGRTFPNLNGNAEYGSMLIAVGCVAAYIAKRTPLGRYIYAVGGNEKAAALSGVKVNRVKYFVYMFSGFCAALVGIIIASQLVAAHPATGDTFELNAIAAAVLGGTSMSGGRGKIGGTIIGAFVIGVLSDGLVMMGVSAFWQTVIKGLVIIAAVVIDQAQQRVQSRVALQAQAALGK